MNTKFFLLSLITITGLILIHNTVFSQIIPKQVEVYFDQDNTPDLKKDIFGANRNPNISTDRLIRELDIDQLNFYYMRYMSSWETENRFGFPQQIFGTLENPIYLHEDFTKIVKKFHEKGSKLVLPITYTPAIMRTENQVKEITPPNLEVWGKLVRHYLEHVKDMGIFPIIEVWNEPDIQFFKGTLEEYCHIYKTVVDIVEDVFQDKAQIGGPVLAFADPKWYNGFLSYTSKNKIRLDFISFHVYDFSTFERAVSTTLTIMKRYGYDLPFYITEYGYWGANNKEAYDNFGLASVYTGAWEWLSCAKAILAHKEIKMALRTRWTDNGVPEQRETLGYKKGGGFISFDGKKRAIYNAAMIYKRMHEDAKAVAIQANANLEAFASSGDGKAYLVLWNTSLKEEVTFTINMYALPSSSRIAHIYRIDHEHNSVEDMGDDNFTESEEPIKINGDHFSYSSVLAPGAVIYFEVLNN